MVGTLVLGALIVLGAGQADAQRVTKRGARVKQVDKALIASLQQAKALLHKANHNYKGHRVAAIKQINKAIHELRKEMFPKGKATVVKTKTPPNPNAPRTPEAQTVSDGQLQQASNNLAATLIQLNGLPSTPRRRNAAGFIKGAINQLTAALATN
jgi:hypothetical protein